MATAAWPLLGREGDCQRLTAPVDFWLRAARPLDFMTLTLQAIPSTGFLNLRRLIVPSALACLLSTLPAWAVVTAPSVANKAPDQLATTSARLRGTITSTGGEAPQAIIYWGTVDGSTNVALWENTAPQGYQANDFSESVTGLAPGTTYYYRATASNSAGTAWADSSTSFTTLPLTPAAIENRDANGLTATTASLGAEVIDGGGSAAAVTIFWGPADGGTDPGAWASIAPVGTASGRVSRFIGGLTPNSSVLLPSPGDQCHGHELGAGDALVQDAERHAGPGCDQRGAVSAAEFRPGEGRPDE